MFCAYCMVLAGLDGDSSRKRVEGSSIPMFLALLEVADIAALFGLTSKLTWNTHTNPATQLYLYWLDLI